uniref:BHLH domain-containing protein n=1 Tax=Aegilops tauschii subsp. strangulata TaxID=200361 RepID=A0A453H0L4_AEGTS
AQLHQVLARSSMYQLETMDDSSLFMQWAVDTLQHDHPPLAAAYAAGDNFPSLEELRRSALQHGTAPAGMAVQDGHRLLSTDSWSSGDSAGRESMSAAVVENDVNCATTCSVGSSNNYLPMSWNFTSAMAQPSNEAAPSPATAPSAGALDGPGVVEQAHVSPPSRRASAKSAARAGHAPYAQDHIMAERKRREKINRRFIELSTVIPGLKKVDPRLFLHIDIISNNKIMSTDWPTNRSDGQGDDPFGRRQVRQGAAGKAQGARGPQPQERRRRVGGARQEVAHRRAARR